MRCPSACLAKFVVVVTALGSLVTVGALSARADGEAIRITRCEIIDDGERPTFEIDGEADLPDGAAVSVGIALGEDAAVTVIRPAVSSKAFAASLTPKGKLLPGVYTIKAFFDRRTQSRQILEALPKEFKPAEATRTVRHGTEEDEKAEREKVRKKYVELFDNLYNVHQMLLQWGSYITQGAKWSKGEWLARKDRKPGEPVPYGKVEDLLGQWDRFRDDYWNSVYQTVRFEDKTFREYVFATYFEKVDRQFDRLYLVLERMYKYFGKDLYTTLDKPVPPEYNYSEPFTFKLLYEESLKIAEETYGLLGEEPVEWRIIDLARPETKDDAYGDLFRSTRSKFEIRKPGEDYLFDYTISAPGLRVRIRPTDMELVKQNVIVMGVEIHDFPTAENFDQLAKLMEIAVVGRWPGFKLLDKKKVRAEDRTMPKGYRPGLDMTFTTEYQGKIYTVRDYALFCRWHKRTYDFITLVVEDKWKSYEPTVQTTAETFKILDDPNIKKILPPTEQEIRGEAPPEDGGGEKKEND